MLCVWWSFRVCSCASCLDPIPTTVDFGSSPRSSEARENSTESDMRKLRNYEATVFVKILLLNIYEYIVYYNNIDVYLYRFDI